VALDALSRARDGSVAHHESRTSEASIEIHVLRGHPRTEENTRVGRGRGYTWRKCRICNNRYMRDYMRRRARERLRRRILAQARADLLREQARADRAEG
jgi:hypothetical protein